MGSRQSIALLTIVMVKTCTRVDCKTEACINIIFPQLYGQGNLHRVVAVGDANPSILHNTDSDLKIQNLQLEITKLQKLVEKSFKQSTVLPSIAKKVETTTQKLTSSTNSKNPVVNKSGIVEENREKFQLGAHEGSEFNLKDLEKEIEILQKQLIEDVTEKVKIKDSVKKSNTNSAKMRSDVHINNQPRIRPHQNINEMYYPYPFYPYYQNHVNKEKKPIPKENEDTQEDDEDDQLLEPPIDEDDTKKRLVGGPAKGIVLELVLEVLKLFAGGDGKNIISLVLKVVPVVLKGLLSGITTSISKGGLKGLLIKYVIPLIVLVGINLLVIFMSWWLWDESSCAKVEELDSKPYAQLPTGYGYRPMYYR